MLEALAATQWLHFAAAMLLFGGSAMRAVFLGQRYGWTAELDRRLFRILLPASVVALLTAGGWLLLAAAEMGGPWGDAVRPRILRIVLTETEFGHLWEARLPLAAAICLIVWYGRGASAALAVAAAALLASAALTGHSVMHSGWLGTVHELNQAAHLLAGGFWLGGLGPLGLLLARDANRPAVAAVTNAALRRFSDVGVLAVLLVLGSGIVNAGMLINEPSDLVTTDYGRTLAIKLALVAAILGVALRNRLWLLPRLGARRSAALGRLEYNVVVEIALGAAIVAVASLLGNLPPPGM